MTPHGRSPGSGVLGVLAVEAGDCVQLPDDELIESVEGVPCDVPHDAQVYSSLDLGGGAFRNDSDIEDEAFKRCLARWGDVVGTDWESDTFHDFLAFYPTSESWAFGDREVLCLVVRLDGGPARRGSALGASS